MYTLLVIGIAIFALIAGYMFYGKWLSKQWGLDPNRKTPAYECEDGKDFVPTKPYIVLGHHFSSIAGAGPVNGPIQAAVFGWVPVLLWLLIGGIFFGAVHDFGALFASLRHKGQTIATVIAENIDDTAKRLFCIFAYLTIILVVAAFSSIVAGTFQVPATTPEAELANQRTAMTSVLFVFAAILYGSIMRRFAISGPVGVIIAVATIAALVFFGYTFPVISLDYTTWMIIIGIYILIASLVPVWVLLQPRDYLSSYLLYGMIALALFGIIGAALTGEAAYLDMPAFTGFYNEKLGFLFPALFITIACGAISGFHSLVASGTTSKQLDNEKNARPVAFGSMLIEVLFGVVALCAVGFVWAAYTSGDYASPTAAFASGISKMIACIPGLEDAEGVAYTLLILAVSAFCLTSLDTSTRIGRYMFQELWLSKGESRETVTGVKKYLSNPTIATIVSVGLGIGLGMTGYQLVWPLFGAANQLLAALGLLAVCAWLGNAGKNNRMFFVPMIFMLIVTVTSLCLTIHANAVIVIGPDDTFAAWMQLILASLLLILAVILAVKGIRVIRATQKIKRAS